MTAGFDALSYQIPNRRSLNAKAPARFGNTDAEEILNKSARAIETAYGNTNARYIRIAFVLGVVSAFEAVSPAPVTSPLGGHRGGFAPMNPFRDSTPLSLKEKAVFAASNLANDTGHERRQPGARVVSPSASDSVVR